MFDVHEDHIAETGYPSLYCFGLVHPPFPITKAIWVPDAKAAIVKEWDKLKNLSAWDASEIKKT